MDGLACLDEIRRRYPDVKVVMLSASTSQDLIETALRKRRVGVCHQERRPDDLPATLRAAVAGTCSRRWPRRRTTRAARRRAGLTDREITILGALARGLSNERDREGVLGRAADGEVPPDEHLPQARREESHRGDPARLPAGPGREPDLLETNRSSAWVGRVAGEEFLLIVLYAAFGIVFLTVFPPTLLVADSWLTLVAGAIRASCRRWTRTYCSPAGRSRPRPDR